MYETISLERENGIAILTLNRPESLNALSFKLIEDLHTAFDELDRDLKSRVLIMAGAGRAFCAGTDLNEDMDKWPEGGGRVQKRYRLQQRVGALSVRMREIPQPVIAAVRGPAAGAGLSLAAAADIRIADQTARFNAAMVTIGASGGDLGTSWLIPRILGPSKAAELLYTGRFVNAEEALSIGLVSQVVPEGDQVEAAKKLAGEIMKNTPLGIRMTKELLNVSLDAPGMRHQIEIENRTQILCALTDDFQETVDAFFQKRKPQYRDA